MTVNEAIATDNGTSPKDGMIGKAWPDWCEVGSIAVNSGRLTAADFAVTDPASGVSAPVAPGVYRVQARIMSFEGSLGICAARALPEAMPPVTRGQLLGKVSVDIAKITIADLADAAQGLTDDDLRALLQYPVWNVFGAMVTLDLPTKSLALPCIASGFGDGSYPAFALASGGTTVGIEVEFVPDGYVFP